MNPKLMDLAACLTWWKFAHYSFAHFKQTLFVSGVSCDIQSAFSPRAGAGRTVSAWCCSTSQLAPRCSSAARRGGAVTRGGHQVRQNTVCTELLGETHSQLYCLTVNRKWQKIMPCVPSAERFWLIVNGACWVTVSSLATVHLSHVWRVWHDPSQKSLVVVVMLRN